MRLGRIIVMGASCILLAGWLAPPAEASEAAAPAAKAGALREQGDFKGADAVLTAAILSGRLSAQERKELEFQRDQLKRIQDDYSLTQQQLFAKVTNAIRDVTPSEFDQWIAQGRFDSLKIDGVTCFLGVSARNLFFRYPELNARRLQPKDEVVAQRRRLEVCRSIKKAALQQDSPYVLPHRFQCTMTLTVDKDAAPEGETIRAWLPIPRWYPFQREFKLLSNSAPILQMASQSSPIRSVYMEEPARRDRPTVFSITYTYEVCGVYFPLDAAQVRAADAADPVLQEFTREAPHVVFTAAIQELASQIAGSQTNPMLEAKAFYDWIAHNVLYSFAREYSTLTNLSDYCLRHRYGDCGQEALLFITLCRCRGIPARWQTGWDIFPGALDIHDWTEIYLAPYGWVPVDPWAGIFATRYSPALRPSERRELRDFYFGGLDFYRMAANSDHSQALEPPKMTMRSDDVDFQRGELETTHTNIYFNHYRYNLNVVDLTQPQR